MVGQYVYDVLKSIWADTESMIWRYYVNNVMYSIWAVTVSMAWRFPYLLTHGVYQVTGSSSIKLRT